MAKQGKELDKGNLANKFDAQGRNLLDIQKERSEAEREHDLMIKNIRETAKTLHISGLLSSQKLSVKKNKKYLNECNEVLLISYSSIR